MKASFKSELGVQGSVFSLKYEKEQAKWWVEERKKVVHVQMSEVGREAQREGNDATHTLLDPWYLRCKYLYNLHLKKRKPQLWDPKEIHLTSLC